VTRPSYDGFASPLQSMASCDKKSYIYCPQDYLIVMQSSSFSASSVVTECQRKPSDYFYGNNFVNYIIIKDVILRVIKIY